MRKDKFIQLKIGTNCIMTSIRLFPYLVQPTMNVTLEWLENNFWKRFLADTLTCVILGPLVSLFWISGNISSEFQNQSGLPYLHW